MFEPPAHATALLQAVATPLLHVNASHQLCWANAAAQTLWGQAMQPGQTLASLWPAATALCSNAPVQAKVDLPGPGAGAVQATGQALADGGWLLTLHTQLHPSLDLADAALAGPAPDSVQRESQMALAVDMAGIGLWRHDLRSNVVHYNAQAQRILGLDAGVESLPGDAARALVHPQDLGAVLAARDAAMRGEPVDVEARFKRSDGSWRLLMTRRVLQRGADGQALAFMGVSLDITDRATLSEHADEMTRRFELVTRTAGIGWWVSDSDTAPATWSGQLRTIFGLAEGEPVPTLRDWLASCAHPDDREVVRHEFARLMHSQQATKELGFRIIHRNGEVRHLYTHSRHEAGAHGATYFGVVVDLTEQRRAEAELKGAAERAALAARGAGLGTWEMDARSKEMRWDEQMWLLRGLQPGARPLNYEERMACLHPDDRLAVSQTLEPALAAGTAVNQEFRVVWPDGSVHWLASRSVELDDGTGQRRRIGVNWDITASRTADIVRQERAMALRENESKSKFLARMSHELRTPLTAVLGFAQLLLQEEKGKGGVATARRKRLEYIHSAGKHLHNLINDVLDLSALQGGELRIALQPVAVAPVVAATLPLLGPWLDGRSVTITCGALDTTVMADATRLRQVLLNLLSNAVKYNHHAGQVHIEALTSGAEVLLRVSDTGRGMSEQQLRHLFEPFNRLGLEGDAVEGTGIGLAIVKTLVERMGGSVQVQSTLGQGSVFDVRLQAGELVLAPAPSANAHSPARAAAAAVPGASEQRPAEAPGTAARTRRHHVLYVEDNPVNAIIIGELMARRDDLMLHVAVDGASGVAQALEIRPDLILLDMQLPDCDGLEVLRRLRAQPATAGIPCIALSANAIPGEIERALGAGLSDYWTKPLDFKAFMSSLDALFGKAP